MSEWQPIETAPKDITEFLGVIYRDGVMAKEPFISFWSPTLNKFFANPSHWIPIPKLPGALGEPVYGEWCRDPELCAGKGYCPRDPTCAD